MHSQPFWLYKQEGTKGWTLTLRGCKIWRLPNSDKNNTSTASHINFRGLHISIFNQHISDNDKTCLLRLQLYIRIVEALRLFIWRAINLSKDSCAYFIAILLAIYDSINWDLCTNFIPARVHMCCLTRKFLKSLNPIDFCFLWLGEREQTMENTCSSTDTSKILKKISARLNLKKKKKKSCGVGLYRGSPSSHSSLQTLHFACFIRCHGSYWLTLGNSLESKCQESTALVFGERWWWRGEER